jgi:hypothetical protein
MQTSLTSSKRPRHRVDIQPEASCFGNPYLRGSVFSGLLDLLDHEDRNWSLLRLEPQSQLFTERGKKGLRIGLATPSVIAP